VRRLEGEEAQRQGTERKKVRRLEGEKWGRQKGGG